MPEDQSRTVIPRPAVDNGLGRPAVEMVQHERPGAECARLFTRQYRIGAQVYPRMVRVRSAPNGHDDQISPLRPVDSDETSGLVMLLVQAGVLCTLPPTISALESFKLKPPLALIPISTDLPTVPGTVHERALEQRRTAGRRDRAQITLRP